MTSIACIIGQSNERGVRRLDSDSTTGAPASATYGLPCKDPIPPNGDVASPPSGT